MSNRFPHRFSLSLYLLAVSPGFSLGTSFAQSEPPQQPAPQQPAPYQSPVEPDKVSLDEGRPVQPEKMQLAESPPPAPPYPQQTYPQRQQAYPQQPYPQQIPATTDAQPTGYHEHDGVLVRLQLGGGYTSMSSEIIGAKAEITDRQAPLGSDWVSHTTFRTTPIFPAPSLRPPWKSRTTTRTPTPKQIPVSDSRCKWDTNGGRATIGVSASQANFYTPACRTSLPTAGLPPLGQRMPSGCCAPRATTEPNCSVLNPWIFARCPRTRRGCASSVNGLANASCGSFRTTFPKTVTLPDLSTVRSRAELEFFFADCVSMSDSF